MLFSEIKEILYISKEDYLNYLKNIQTCSNKVISRRITELIEFIIETKYNCKVRYNNESQTIQLMYKAELIQFYPQCITSNTEELKELLMFISVLVDIPDTKGIANAVLTMRPSTLSNKIYNYFSFTYSLDTIKKVCNKINSICGCLMVVNRFKDIEVREAINTIYNNCIELYVNSEVADTLSKFLDIYDSSTDTYHFYKYRNVSSYEKALTYLEAVILPTERILYTTTINNAINSKGFTMFIARNLKEFTNTIRYDKHEVKLAPSPTLLYSIKNGNISWEEYERLLCEELKLAGSFDLLANYIKYHGKVTIMCYCSKTKRCHRQTIATIMKNDYGILTQEL